MNNLSARHFFQKLFSLKWECIGLACVVFLSIMIFRAASLTEVSVEISSSRKTSVEIFYLDTHISADNYSLQRSVILRANSQNSIICCPGMPNTAGSDSISVTGAGSRSQFGKFVSDVIFFWSIASRRRGFFRFSLSRKR